MIDIAAARRDIEERNRLRADAALPQLSVEAELRRLSEAERRKAFEGFCVNSPLRQRAEEKLLNRIRRSNKDPEWCPTGTLSGGGWAFYSAVRDRMMRIWCCQQRKA
ncbi:MAG: hypothetical protein ACLQIQ_07910 [Beijerinckiaceae bacterium]